MPGTVYVDSATKLPDGVVLSVGRVLIGGNDTLNPEDLGMNLIRGIHFTPWGAPVAQSFIRGRHELRVMTGSIGSLESETGNYVRVNTSILRGTGFVPVGYPGTLYTGTATGSTRASYIAWGR